MDEKRGVGGVGGVGGGGLRWAARVAVGARVAWPSRSAAEAADQLRDQALT